MTIYGPYTRPDSRKHIVHYENGTRRTQSYPRYLMEQHLGRELRPEEHVDHINNDKTDNRIENLQLLTLAANNRKSAIPARTYIFLCPVCGKEAEIPYRRYKANQIIQDKAGPYCSRSCAGKVHH